MGRGGRRNGREAGGGGEERGKKSFFLCLFAEPESERAWCEIDRVVARCEGKKKKGTFDTFLKHGRKKKLDPSTRTYSAVLVLAPYVKRRRKKKRVVGGIDGPRGMNVASVRYRPRGEREGGREKSPGEIGVSFPEPSGSAWLREPLAKGKERGGEGETTYKKGGKCLNFCFCFFGFGETDPVIFKDL